MYCCIGFIDLLFGNERLTDFTSLFLPSNFKENHRKTKQKKKLFKVDKHEIYN